MTARLLLLLAAALTLQSPYVSIRVRQIVPSHPITITLIEGDPKMGLWPGELARADRLAAWRLVCRNAMAAADSTWKAHR